MNDRYNNVRDLTTLVSLFDLIREHNALDLGLVY